MASQHNLTAELCWRHFVPELTVKIASSKLLQSLPFLLPGNIHVHLGRQWHCTQKKRVKARKRPLLASFLVLTHPRTHHSYFTGTSLLLIQAMEIVARPFSFFWSLQHHGHMYRKPILLQDIGVKSRGPKRCSLPPASLSSQNTGPTLIS